MNDCLNWEGVLNSGGYATTRRIFDEAYVGRILMSFMHGPLPKGVCVLHRCDNPRCIKIEHLWLGTQGDNMRDKFLKGRATGKGHCGEEHYSHKLTTAQVIEARKRFKQGEKCRKIADEYGMTYWSMWAAITGETWKHLK